MRANEEMGVVMPQAAHQKQPSRQDDSQNLGTVERTADDADRRGWERHGPLSGTEAAFSDFRAASAPRFL